jgi:putative tryptophan/tyrosine transport system substrate-binding protein
MIDRRAFVTGLGAVLATPLGAVAQQTHKVLRIGVLAPTAARQPPADAFNQALGELGWVQGQTINIETRFPVGPEGAVEPAVADLVALGVDVLVVWGTVGALAAKRATTQIPTVFLATGDPVSLGLVSNLAHPAGNMTGVPAIASSEEFVKRLALLKEAAPSIARVAVLVGSDGRPLMDLNRAAMTTAAHALRLELEEVQVTWTDVETGVQKAKVSGAQALYVWPSSLALASRRKVCDAALAAHLPSVHPFAENAIAGGLLSYSASLTGIARRGATVVDKILRGAKPGDLPVEQPTMFELIINLKTAKILGLTIPPSLLLRADQVIE